MNKELIDEFEKEYPLSSFSVVEFNGKRYMPKECMTQEQFDEAIQIAELRQFGLEVWLKQREQRNRFAAKSIREAHEYALEKGSEHCPEFWLEYANKLEEGKDENTLLQDGEKLIIAMRKLTAANSRSRTALLHVRQALADISSSDDLEIAIELLEAVDD